LAPRTRKAPQLGIILDAARPDPLHQQIGAQIRRAILDRRLAPGTKLPSSRLMAVELSCARGTVLLALEQLCAEGYLVTQAGKGIFVAANLPDEMLVVSRVGDAHSDDALALPRRTADLPLAGSAAPPGDPPIAFPFTPDRKTFPFPLWAKLLEREWRAPAWQIAGAPHPFGHPGLRDAIAAYLGVARGFTCDPRAVVITSGVRQGLSLFSQVVLKAGDQAWIEEPCFAGTREALSASDFDAVSVPIDASGFSVDAALLLAPEARLAVVTPSHQYPIGTVLGLERRLALLNWAERRKSWIVEDDFDGEYRYSGRPLAPLRALDRIGRVAYLGSFSKLLFPALRLSYLVLPAALVEPTERTMERVPERASLLGQGALARFLADGHFTAHLRRTRLLYANRQQALIACAQRHLDGFLDITPDPGGMHVIARPRPDLATFFDDRAVTAAAAALGVTVSPLSVCYAGTPKAQGLMLGYAGTPEDEIEPAILTLRAALTVAARN
jgi:GntR family transcriptional regulator/MocR family aminotransferase